MQANILAFINIRPSAGSTSADLGDLNAGDIIAAVSSPSFDPNLFVRGISSRDYTALTENDHRPLANKVVHVNAGQLTHYAGDYQYYLDKTHSLSARAALTASSTAAPSRSNVCISPCLRLATYATASPASQTMSTEHSLPVIAVRGGQRT